MTSHVAPLPATLPAAIVPHGAKESRNSPNFEIYEWRHLVAQLRPGPWEGQVRPGNLKGLFWELDSPVLSVPRLVYLRGKRSAYVYPCDQRT